MKPKEAKSITDRIALKQAVIRNITELRTGESYEERNARRALDEARTFFLAAEERVAKLERTKARADELIDKAETEIVELLRLKESADNLPSSVLERKLRKRARILRELAELNEDLS